MVEELVSLEGRMAGNLGTSGAGVQGFGYLIAADSRFQRIVMASENVAEIATVSARDLVGCEALSVFSREELHQMRNILGHGGIAREREGVFSKVIDQTSYRVFLHGTGSFAVAELIPEVMPIEREWSVIERAKGLLSMPLAPAGIGHYLGEAMDYFRSVTGFDRVSYLRFATDGAGDVIAEARHPDMRGLEGQAFAAHELACLTGGVAMGGSIRVIGDVGAQKVGLIGDPDGGVDLSLAMLVGTSKQQRKMLASMGVASSLVLMLFVADAPLGAVICHNQTPVVPSPATLNAMEWVARMVALRVGHALEIERYHKGTATGDHEATLDTVPAVPLPSVLRRALGRQTNGMRSLRMRGSRVQVSPLAAETLIEAFRALSRDGEAFRSLSALEGAVDLNWSVEDAGLRIRWVESGVDLGDVGERMKTARDAIPARLGGEALVEASQTGIEAVFLVPLRHVRGPGGRVRKVVRRALLVEDDYIAAKVGAAQLKEAGFALVDVAATLQEAAAFLERNEYDFSLLDLDWNGEDGAEIAVRLETMEVPFAYATGFIETAQHLAKDRDAQILAKPVDASGLAAVLKRIERM